MVHASLPVNDPGGLNDRVAALALPGLLCSVALTVADDAELAGFTLTCNDTDVSPLDIEIEDGDVVTLTTEPPPLTGAEQYCP